MNLWIQVDVGIREHDKIYNLADALKIPDAHAVGLMVCLWTWAVTSAPDGDITDFPARALAKAAGWEKKPETFYEAIRSPRSLFVEQVDGRLRFRNWEERAGMLMEALDRNREQTRKRVQRYRDRKAAENDGEVTGSNDDVTGNESVTPSTRNARVTGNSNGESVTVTPLPDLTEPDRTVTQTEHNQDRTSNEGASAPYPQRGAEAAGPTDKAAPIPYEKIKELYNGICVSFPKIQRIDGQRQKAVGARYKTYGSIEAFRTLFEKTEASSFLKGANDRNWSADFDWLIKPTNMTKVLEGKYDDDRGPALRQTGSGKPDTLGALARIIAEEEGGVDDD